MYGNSYDTGTGGGISSTLAKTMGLHSHWGLSAAFDVLETRINGIPESKVTSSVLRVLLIEPGDIRHILFTIARRRRFRLPDGSLIPIHFYLLESPLEVLGRDLLQLQLICDNEMPIRQKANTFLEVFGNCKVQKRTAFYVEVLGNRLKLLMKHMDTTTSSTTTTGGKDNVVEGISDNILDEIVDLSLLRYRERDELENVFSNYSKSSVFKLDALLDQRFRSLYEDRFDNRKALYDWDYHATLKTAASIIHIKQYKDWRHSGIAFEFGDQIYSEPNRTLMTYTEGVMKKGKDKGIKKEVSGYWGDIVCSPYFSFGIDCETADKFSEGLFEIYNKNTGTEQHRHHTIEVALFNLFSILWEIETAKVYHMTVLHDIYSGLGLEASYESTALEDGLKTDHDSNDVDDESSKQDSSSIDNQASNNNNNGSTKTKKGSSEMGSIAEENEADDDNLLDPISEDVPDSSIGTEGVGATTNSNGNSNYKGYSSSSQDPQVKWQETQRLQREVAAAIQQAETIVESYQDIKVFGVSGQASEIFDKSKFEQFFDVVYVSSRAAHVVGQPFFGKILKSGEEKAVVAVETSKFLVPLSKNMRSGFNAKIEEYALKSGLNRLPQAPVRRRRRDENDLEDDVLFFATS
eukprot:gene31277-40647_t